MASDGDTDRNHAMRKGKDAMQRSIVLGQHTGSMRAGEFDLVAELAGRPVSSRSCLWCKIFLLGFLPLTFVLLALDLLDLDEHVTELALREGSAAELNDTRSSMRTLNLDISDQAENTSMSGMLAELRALLFPEDIEQSPGRELHDPSVESNQAAKHFDDEDSTNPSRKTESAVLVPDWMRSWTGENHNSSHRVRDWNYYDSFARPLGAFRRLQDRNLHKRRWKLRSSKVGVNRLNSRHLRLFEVVVLFLIVVCGVGYMVPRGMRDHGPRQHAHTGDAGPPFIGTATLKVPPCWSAEKQSSYSLRSWISDLVLWSTATDLEVHRLGPIAALQISGSARELVREIPPEHLAHGIQDQQGQHTTGLMLLVRTLANRYALLDQEAITKAIGEFMAFARLPNEPVDALLVRFDVLRNRAAIRGGLALNTSGLAWVLLRALNLPPELLDRL